MMKSYTSFIFFKHYFYSDFKNDLATLRFDISYINLVIIVVIFTVNKPS